MRMIIEVERVPGLGYFARARTADGAQLMPTSKEDGPTTIVSYWADSVEAINEQKVKVERHGHVCDVVYTAL